MTLEDEPQPGQGGGRVQHPVVLLLIAQLPPPIVVAVLAPPRGIGTDRLDVTSRVRADPHVLRGRRYYRCFDAREGNRVADWLRIRPEVAETAAAAAAPYSRAGEVAAT